MKGTIDALVANELSPPDNTTNCKESLFFSNYNCAYTGVGSKWCKKQPSCGFNKFEWIYTLMYIATILDINLHLEHACDYIAFKNDIILHIITTICMMDSVLVPIS